MKKTLLFTNLLFGILLSNAQYTPLVNENNTWLGVSYGWVTQNFIMTIDGDSVVDGETYKVSYWQNATGGDPFVTALLREDTDEQRVYLTDGTSEHLLYDFSLEAGDTATVWGVGSPHFITITSVGTTMVGGTERKVLNFEDAWAPAYWIEGIGSNYGIADAAIGTIFDYSPHITCFYEGNDLAWSNPVNETPCGLFLGIDEEVVDFDMVIGPNPVGDVLNIYFPAGLSGRRADVKVFSGTGELVYSKQLVISSQMKIDMPDMSEGLYLLNLSSQGQMIDSKQFIKRQ